MKCSFHTKNKKYILLMIVFIFILCSCKEKKGLTWLEKQELLYNKDNEIIYEGKKLRLDDSYFKKDLSVGNIYAMKDLAIMYGTEDKTQEEDGVLKEVLLNYSFWLTTHLNSKKRYELYKEVDEHTKIYKVFHYDRERMLKITFWGDKNQHYLSVLGDNLVKVNEQFDEIVN